ncbi:MAG: patatin-like phospholipase family protein [Defluviitaleaceae bacterium]|nr:patatin-like phospholipase family protein [Defluviitaleaceae bacterium]
MKFSKIGLALSGGGIRAAVFHLGVLQYMAEVGLFSRITSISSVSGASMCMGIIFAVNDNKWPSEEEFLKNVQPRVRKRMLRHNIQKAALLRLPFSPSKWHNRVGLLSKMLEEKWGIRGCLQDLPLSPFWEINCTTFETGNRFRFRRDYMGDQKIGYVQNPNLPISDMIAASAAFPVLIGPYVLKTQGLLFTKDKKGKLEEVSVSDSYTLWDGGVFDNLGLDALHKIGRGLDDSIDFLIVSNASAPVSRQNRGRPSKNARRLLDIATGQVDALRTRDLFSSVIKKEKGLYLKIGNTPESGDFSEKDAIFAMNYPTTLNSPSENDFNMIFRHGYENARFTLPGRKYTVHAPRP